VNGEAKAGEGEGEANRERQIGVAVVGNGIRTVLPYVDI